MEKSYNYLLNLINEGDKIVIGVSGGPDSMCLLHLLIKIREKIDFNIIVAHINHNVRKESDSEELFVKDVCLSKNVIFESKKLLCPPKTNFESFARNFRYEFFEEIIKKYNARYLMTAHHGDDLIETVLMKISRGSNIKGYSGFSIIDYRNGYDIVRPLIFYTKEDIDKYLCVNNISYCVDKSNDSLVYTRNRYRHKILPLLKYENENIHEKYMQFSEDILSVSNILEKYSKIELSRRIKDNSLDIESFNELEFIMKKYIIYYFLEKNDINMENINNKHIKSIIDIINNKKPTIYIVLPDNKKVIKEYNKLYIKNVIDHEKKIQKVKIDDKVFWDDKIIEKVSNCDLTSNYVTYIDSNTIKLPLYVRCRKNGDKIKIKNMEGHKKIKDIFINEKIDLLKRDRWPIVVDSNDEVIWIPGVKKSHFDSKNTGKYDIILKYY